MKRTVIQRALVWFLAAALTVPLLTAVSFASGSNPRFAQELAQLLKEDDTSGYFGSMKLTIGANTLKLDGAQQSLDVAPEIKNNRTMLPIRAVAESVGATVDYDAVNRAVIISNEYGDEIYCPIGVSSISINEDVHAIDTAPYIKNGRTYLPVRAVAEALNLDVDWDASTSTVTLTAPYQTARVVALGSNVNPTGLGAKKAIHDGSGLWVLQFDTPSEAKAAVETLQSRGITAAGDAYIPPVEDGYTLTSSAQSGHNSWGAVNCNFDSFINKYSSQFKGSATVAVVDSGVDASHSFLRGKVLSGIDFVDGDSTPNDEHGHGTHVSATIIDCVGTAPVKILPVRVLDSRGRSRSSTVVSGIKYAADQGADVINLSLGGEHDEVTDWVINYAVNKGSLVVVAAGNDNMDTKMFCPAHMTSSGTVVVSAGDTNHNKARFSNYGSSVDLMAPGVGIKAALPGNQYGSWDGTSMAAPHVSAAAVLLDLATGKTLSPGDLEKKVQSAADGNGKWGSSYKGYGFLDMSKADLGETVTPSVSLALDQPVYMDNDTAELGMSCTYSNTALDSLKIHLGTSRTNLKPFSLGKPNSSNSPYRTSYVLNMESEPAGTTWYYQFEVTAGGKTYQSDIGSVIRKQTVQPNKVTVTIKEPTEFTRDYIQLNMECSYTGTAPDSVKLYTSRSRSDWSNSNPSAEKITPQSNPFRFSHGIKLGTTVVQPGDVFYYQFGVVVNGVEYKSEVASFTVKEAEAPQPTTNGSLISFELDYPNYNESLKCMYLAANAYSARPIKYANIYLYTYTAPGNKGEWVKVGTADSITSIGSRRRIFYQLDVSKYTVPDSKLLYRFGAVLEDGSEYMSDSSYFSPAQLPKEGNGSASVGRITRDASGRVWVYVDYNMRSGESVDHVLIRQADCKAQVGANGHVVLAGKVLPARGSYQVGFGNVPKGEYRYFQLEFYGVSGKMLYRTEIMTFAAPAL